MTHVHVQALAVAGILFSAPAGLAETQDRSSFDPVSSTAIEMARGTAAQQPDDARNLPPLAKPDDVDANGDGRISFAELARHDLVKDF